MACIAQKCKDPCPGACGVDARCQVTGHNPVCSCPNGYAGDPFIKCQPKPVAIGTPVVKPECEVDPDCQTTQACIEQRCIDPCIQRPGICAPNAECRVIQHRPVCVCAEGFTGNPQVQCFQGKLCILVFTFIEFLLKQNVSIGFQLVADPIPIVLRTKLALTASVRIHAFLKRAVPTPCAVLMPIDRSASVLNAMKATPTVPVVNPSVSSIMIVRARWLVVKRTAVTHAIVHQTPNVPSSITCLDALARLDIRENRTQPEDVTYQVVCF